MWTDIVLKKLANANAAPAKVNSVWRREKNAYDEVGDGCADGHDDVSAARGPQRAARRTELMRKLLKGERCLEHERYEAERERRGRYDEHE